MKKKERVCACVCVYERMKVRTLSNIYVCMYLCTWSIRDLPRLMHEFYKLHEIVKVPKLIVIYLRLRECKTFGMIGINCDGNGNHADVMSNAREIK